MQKAMFSTGSPELALQIPPFHSARNSKMTRFPFAQIQHNKIQLWHHSSQFVLCHERFTGQSMKWSAETLWSKYCKQILQWPVSQQFRDSFKRPLFSAKMLNRPTAKEKRRTLSWKLVTLQEERAPMGFRRLDLPLIESTWDPVGSVSSCSPKFHRNTEAC